MELPEFGFDIELKIHLKSEDMGHNATVSYTLPKHEVPTKETLNVALTAAITTANGMGKVDDFRLLTLEDYGIATPNDLRWEIKL